MTRTQLLNEIEEILELDPGTLTGDEPLVDLEGWDSLATLSYIAMADEKLNVQLSGIATARAATVNDLVALLGDKISA